MAPINLSSQVCGGTGSHKSGSGDSEFSWEGLREAALARLMSFLWREACSDLRDERLEEDVSVFYPDFF